MIIEDAINIAAITSTPGNTQAAFVGGMLSSMGTAITNCAGSCTFTTSGDAQTDMNYLQQLNNHGYAVTNNGDGTITIKWTNDGK
jgi:hypothetical protein